MTNRSGEYGTFSLDYQKKKNVNNVNLSANALTNRPAYLLVLPNHPQSKKRESECTAISAFALYPLAHPSAAPSPLSDGLPL